MPYEEIWGLQSDRTEYKMNQQDSVIENDDPSSFLLSEDERNSILLGRMNEERLEDRHKKGQDKFISVKNIVSYEEMILKNNRVIENTSVEEAGIHDNIGDREAVFLHEAGEKILVAEKRWFAKKKSTLSAHLTLMERRIARNLRESLSSSEKKMMKEYTASLFE